MMHPLLIQLRVDLLESVIEENVYREMHVEKIALEAIRTMLPAKIPAHQILHVVNAHRKAAVDGVRVQAHVEVEIEVMQRVRRVRIGIGIPRSVLLTVK
mmetsp:Transcript_5724/g.8688  ORF Transcript_5724/g.8688 Transcript_5724/m.8688 type:complete len:99 (+) Transcript_5724:1901-2197(+)